MTERELRAVAEAIARTGSKEWYDDGDEDSQGFRELASAAIQSSDSKYVKGLVEALREIAKEEYRIIPTKPAWGIAVTALQQLPEDLR